MGTMNEIRNKRGKRDGGGVGHLIQLMVCRSTDHADF